MPKKIYKPPLNLQIENMKRQYSQIIKNIPKEQENLKNNFVNLVIPSLCEPKILSEISFKPRYICLFKDCSEQKKSFASKQKFIQHLKIIHDHELPMGGAFISPNDKSTQPGGFWCSVCGHHYCRRDHLLNHFKTSIHCTNAEVSFINPLELKDIEYEEKLSITNCGDEKNNLYLNEGKMRAICWKENSNDEKTKESDQFTDEDLIINRMNSSFSMISINNEPKIECKRSVTIYSFHSKFFENLHAPKRKNNEDDYVEPKKSKQSSESLEEDEEILNVLLKFENSKN